MISTTSTNLNTSTDAFANNLSTSSNTSEDAFVDRFIAQNPNLFDGSHNVLHGSEYDFASAFVKSIDDDDPDQGLALLGRLHMMLITFCCIAENNLPQNFNDIICTLRQRSKALNDKNQALADCMSNIADVISTILATQAKRAEAQAQAQAEAERLAQAKAEEERLAREKAEEERLAQEKAEAARVAKQKAEHQAITQYFSNLLQAQSIGPISTHCDYCDCKVEYCKKPNTCVKCGKGYDVCDKCDNKVCYRCPK